MDKIELNIANITKTNKCFHERTTAQEQDKVSLHLNLEDLWHDVGKEVRQYRLHCDIGEQVRDQAEETSTFKYSLIAGLFNRKSPVSKTSDQLKSYSPSRGVNAAHLTNSKEETGWWNWFRCWWWNNWPDWC